MTRSGSEGNPATPATSVMTSGDLFEDLRNAQDELQMNRAPGHRYEGGASAGAWAPTLDITESKDAYLITIELPSVKPDDVEITFENGLLTIQGERHDDHDPAGEKVHRVERRYGAFRRSIMLPGRLVLGDKIEASVQDGVLRILVPKWRADQRQTAKPSDSTFVDQVQAARRNRELITELARWRTEHGPSQAEVAKRMHTSQPAVARLESHQHDAQLSTLARYVTALGLSMHFVLTDRKTGEPTWTSMEEPLEQAHHVEVAAQ
jgi:HSP20 family protein